MMEPMDGWETLEKIKANPATGDIPVLMFSAKKITPEEAQEHCLSIEDFVSKPVNPAQLLDAINRIFERRKAVKTEAMQAKDNGVDPALIEEYSAFRKSIEVDKNLLAVLKKSSGTHIPGREVPQTIWPPSAGSRQRSLPTKSGSARSTGNSTQGPDPGSCARWQDR